MEMTDEEIGFLDLTTEKSDNLFQWALEGFNMTGDLRTHFKACQVHQAKA